MRGRIAIGLLAAAFGLAGCEKADRGAADRDVQDQTPYEQLYTTADTSDTYQSNDPSVVTPVQGGATKGGALTATGNFTGSATGAPAGSVTVTEAGEGGGTEVRIKIDRYTAGSEVQAVLARGRCAAAGQTIARIGGPIRVDSSGFGTHVASVSQQTASVLDGQHSIRLTGAGSQEVLACADLPATQG